MSWPSGPCSLKSDCLCPYGQLRPKYKCIVCNRQLHHFYRGCSIQALTGDNDKVLCKDGFGCQKKKKGKHTKSAKARIAAEEARIAAIAALQDVAKQENEEPISMVPLPNLEPKEFPKPKISVDIPDNKPPNLPLIVPPKFGRELAGIQDVMEDRITTGTIADQDDEDHEDDRLSLAVDEDGITDNREPKKRTVYPGGKRRGIRKGAKLQSNKTLEDWYYACQTYEKLRATTHPKLSHVDFLTSDHSSDLFTGTLSERQSFGRYITRYKQGILQPLRVKRNKQRKYPDIEAKLIAYLDLRKSSDGNSDLFPADEKLSWKTLRQKCKEWAKEAGYTDFHVSPGWMDDTLKRHNRSTPGEMRSSSRKRPSRTNDDIDQQQDSEQRDKTNSNLMGAEEKIADEKSKRTVGLMQQRPLAPAMEQAQAGGGGVLAPTPLQNLMHQQQPFPQMQFPQEFIPSQMQFAPQQFNFSIPSQQGVGFMGTNFGHEQIHLTAQQGGFVNFGQQQQQNQQQQPQQLLQPQQQQQQLPFMQQHHFPNPQIQEFQQQQQLLFQMQQSSQQQQHPMAMMQQQQIPQQMQNVQQSAQQGGQSNPFFQNVRQQFGA